MGTVAQIEPDMVRISEKSQDKSRQQWQEETWWLRQSLNFYLINFPKNRYKVLWAGYIHAYSFFMRRIVEYSKNSPIFHKYWWINDNEWQPEKTNAELDK